MFNLIKGITKIATSPIRGVVEVFEDVSGKNSESEQSLSILSMGVSSIVKGTVKGIKSGLNEL